MKLQFPAIAAADAIGRTSVGVKPPDVKFFPGINLRGFGKIAAAYRVLPSSSGSASITHIRCESAEKSLLLQAKYLSDLTALPGVAELNMVTKHGRASVRQAPGGGCLACMAIGSDVFIVAGSTEDELTRQLSTNAGANGTPDSFTPRAEVPMYLNRFDKYGLLYYYGAWVARDDDQNYDYSQDVKFVKENDTGLIIWENTFQDDTAEGMTDVTWWDWIQTNCKKADVPLHVNLSLSFPMLWLGNRYRDQTMLKAPQFVGGFYGVAHDSCGVGQLSWHATTAVAAGLGVSQTTVKRFVDDPNIVGWLEPHGETSEMPQALLLESGPVPDEALRVYLRSKYETLEAVGKRWWGDPGHYKSWNAIVAPELAEFVGFGPDAVDLQTVWKVKYLPAPDGHMYTRGESQSLGGVVVPTQDLPIEWTKPEFDDSGWDSFLAPGNDRGIDMVWSPLVYRRTITLPDNWVSSHPQTWLYLWVVFGRDFDDHQVYVNGQKMPRDPHLTLAYEVTSALKAGENSIVLVIARGIICYRTYLSHEPPAQYPNLGKEKNARWVDFNQWTMNARAIQIGRGLEMIRQIDPHRPINVMAPDENAGIVKQTATKFGGHFHNTGYAAGFWADYNPMLMRSVGLPSTAEPGNGAPNVTDFHAFWGRWLTESLNGVHYFMHLGEVTWRPAILAEFLKNRTMYETIGKYHDPEAEVAILFSTRNEQISAWPWTQDPAQFHEGGYWRYSPSYGLLNFCPRDGVGEEDFETETVNKYRVIVDSNTSIFSDTLLGNIEKWVRGGGVFIAYGQTGRHLDTDPDTWPISELSGYKVSMIADWSKNSHTHAAPDQTVFGPDVWDNNYAGLHLTPMSPTCESLVLWADGSTAVGMRQVGKGWIMTVGPEFNGNDAGKLLGPIISHFGAKKRVPCTASGNVHFRHYIGNTGLHDIWVLFNESNSVINTDLTFIPGYNVPSMIDVVTGEAADINRNDTGDTILNIGLDVLETRMWVSPRTDVTSSPLEWISLQRGWWRGTDEPDMTPLPGAAEQQKFSVDMDSGWRFKSADSLTDDEAAALTLPSVADATWEKRNIGIWTPDHPDVHRAVMRRTFKVPATWTNGYVGLCVSHAAGVFVDEGRIFVDGQAIEPRFRRDGIYLDPANNLLQPGGTHVLSLDIQSKSAEAGARGHAWIYYTPNPEEKIDLSGAWDRFTDTVHQDGQITVPGNVEGQYFSRKVMVDRKYAGKNILVHVESRSVKGVIVNGKLTIRASNQVYGSRFSINVTPYIRLGEQNLIDLVNNGGTNSLDVVQLHIYDKNVYP
jgi:hypothetical protein